MLIYIVYCGKKAGVYMSSVTHRIKEIKQPYGGYLRPRDSIKTQLNDGIQLHPEENLHASIVGTVVDYMTRYMLGSSAEEAFRISLAGAAIIGETRKARKLLACICGLANESIFVACKLVGYDVCLRAGISSYKPVDDIEPDEKTIFNIRTMVNRSISFWENYGPIVKDGFTFEGGYTETVDSGDGDYLTKDTLWDFKVSKDGPKTNHTLQLLLYYIMGCHSIHSEFNTISKLGIYNPRLNVIYTYHISKIPKEVIADVERDVIGYSDEKFERPHEEEERVINDTDEEWKIDDLVRRYDVSRAKITGDFIKLGLPYYKVGRSYRFNPDEVVEWEIDQRAIPYGKNGEIVLPAYTEYRIVLKSELRIAKKNKDKERIRAIKKEWKRCGYSNGIASVIWSIIAVVLFGLAFWVLANR